MDSLLIEFNHLTTDVNYIRQVICILLDMFIVVYKLINYNNKPPNHNQMPMVLESLIKPVSNQIMV